MLQERGPRQKTRLMIDIITFEVGNSTILNQDGKMKILSHVACFYSKCLAKMKSFEDKIQKSSMLKQKFLVFTSDCAEIPRNILYWIKGKALQNIILRTYQE